ncbi:MAG: hypothetical protein RRA35_06705 [Desulfomonilia bacterium]|nr:hypothetical protein [Desulfomonilia bacterium]
MVLSRAVMNDKGMALCAEGTELNAIILERLKKMNVESLVVKGHPVDIGDEKTLEQKIAETEYRFSRMKGDPIMEDLKAAVLSALKVQGREEETTPGETDHG